MEVDKIPYIHGDWTIRGKTILYENVDDTKANLRHPETIEIERAIIKQNGRLFTFDDLNGGKPKLGVFEPVYLGGKFRGWKAHMVDSEFDNDLFIFNFTHIDKANIVNRFDITYMESGFQKNNPQQTPRVEYATAKRIYEQDNDECEDCEK